MTAQCAKRKARNAASRLLNFRFKSGRGGSVLLRALYFALFFCAACSVPNLEKPECTEARGGVKEFYSHHFGSEMKFTPENLKSREKFLSPELTKLLGRFATESDPFTLTTDDPPKAFSVSGCRVIGANRAEVGVLLFWRDDARTEQKKIQIETLKESDKWLIDNIYNDQINLRKILNH